MLNNKRLVLAHFWFAFVTFGVALLLGAWQMYVRSPMHTWLHQPELYYRSVTAHGSVMGYVFPTLIAMGFGYAISEMSLDQPLVGKRWAWLGWWLVAVGSVLAVIPVALGRASVLYTFYPPMVGHALYYIGVVLVVVGSWIWVALMAVVAASSFWIHQIRLVGPFSPIHLLSIFTLVMLPLAVWRARTHRAADHRRIMILLFTGALVVAGLFTLVPGRIMHQVFFGA